ncbi:flippase [Pedobacter sp. SYSU D00535]|uniref:flippase n=1 Tax=Pedobacter sp. SYSU D00535 TaxID=2810308 RepID=UPI001A9635D1|nr:flippase [Pedobacter sp. SYSU D00535]
MVATKAKAGTSLLKNFFSLSLVQLANNFLPLLTIPVIARVIGPDKLGAINFATAVVTYFTLLINYGFDLSATREIAKNRNNPAERSRIFNEIFFAKLFLTVISVLIFIPVLLYVPKLAADRELFFYTFLMVFSVMITPNWLYQGMQELHRIAVFNLIAKVLFTIAILLVIKERSDYLWQPLIISVSQIVVGIVSFYWAIKRYSITISTVKLRKILDVLWNEKTIFFSMVVVTLYTTTNTIVLGVVQSNTDVAFYTAGWKFVVIFQTLISTPLSLSLFPLLGESFGKGRIHGLEKVKQFTPFITIFTTLAGIGIYLTAPWIVQIFYGSEFKQAATVLRILCFIPMIIALSNLFGVQTMINLKMDKSFFRITLLGAIVGLGLNFFLSKQMGAIGTAWAWLLTELIITISMWTVLYFQQIQLIDLNYFKYKYLLEVVRPFYFAIRQKVYKTHNID